MALFSSVLKFSFRLREAKEISQETLVYNVYLWRTSSFLASSLNSSTLFRNATQGMSVNAHTQFYFIFKFEK